MSTLHACSWKTEKKIRAALILMCLFLLSANFSTWKANITSPANARASAIARTAIGAFSQTDESSASGTLSLSAEELTNRTAFPSEDQPYLTLPVANGLPVMGNIDEMKQTATGLLLRGWIFIPERNDHPEFVVAVADGKVVGSLKVREKRPDVAKALSNDSALRTGYNGQINVTLNTTRCNIMLFALTSSLTLYPMPSACDKAGISNH